MSGKNGADMLYDEHLAGTIFHGYFRGKPEDDRQPMFERLYMRVLTELSVNRFKWIGLPDECSKRFLEMNLFRSAFGLFFYDKIIDKYVVTRAARNGNVNYYDDPTGWNTAAVNYPNRYVSATDETDESGKGVPIWANYLRVPDMDIVMVYSYRLAVLDRTLEINSMNARQNKVVFTNRRQQLTHSNIAREAANGNNVIEIAGAMSDMEFMKAIDLAIDGNLISELSVLRAKTWSECMGLLGIDNANQDKKERLVEAEVGANDDQSSLMRSVNLNARQEACALMKEIYKIDVWVEYNTEVSKMVGLPDFAVAALEAKGYTVVNDAPMVDDDTSVLKEESDVELHNADA